MLCQIQVHIEVAISADKVAVLHFQQLTGCGGCFVVGKILTIHVGLLTGTDFIAQRDGLLLVDAEHVLCGGTFQAVILFLTDVILPERARQAVNVRRGKNKVAVLCKELDFYVFHCMVILNAAPLSNIAVVQRKAATGGIRQFALQFKAFAEDITAGNSVPGFTNRRKDYFRTVHCAGHCATQHKMVFGQLAACGSQKEKGDKDSFHDIIANFKVTL